MISAIRSALRRRAARSAAERDLRAEIDAQYFALALRLEEEHRRWYAGTGPKPLMPRLPVLPYLSPVPPCLSEESR